LGLIRVQKVDDLFPFFFNEIATKCGNIYRAVLFNGTLSEKYGAPRRNAKVFSFDPRDAQTTMTTT